MFGIDVSIISLEGINASCFMTFKLFRDLNSALMGFGAVTVVGKDTLFPVGVPFHSRGVSSQAVVSGFSDPNTRWAFG